jgi:superfamily II DNA or RNA helicase
MEKNKIEPIEAYNKLRNYQKDACEKMLNYFDYYNGKETIKTALVAMPTGSGKTPIIAFLSRCYKNIGNVLVISPRVSVSEQLFREIDTFFNSKLKLVVEMPKTVKYYENKLSENDINSTNLVLVSTIQKLDYIYRNKKENSEYFKLRKMVTLVIFDEGHYEPAISWSNTIRQFNCPRILFTATPFRNDLKSFDFDDNFKHFLTYNFVKKLNYLRKVEFEDYNLSKFDEKIGHILKRFNEKFPKSAEPKLIISCDNRDTILRIAKIIKTSKTGFYAIHETFDNSFKKNLDEDISNSFLQHIPRDPSSSTIPIWIHQYKLLEGIDIPTFQMLAIIEPFRNTRALIQQIGRIIRNIKKDDQSSLVLNYTSNNYSEEWNSYLELDESGEIMLGFSHKTFSQFRNLLPERAYIDKKFRNKIDFTKFSHWNISEIIKEISLPLKVNLIEKLSNFRTDAFIELEIEKRFKENDIVYFSNTQIKEFYVFYYFTITNSTFLKEAYFPIIKHDVCFFKVYDSFIAFYDSSEYLPLGKDEIGLGLSIDPNKLKKIFRDSYKTILTQVSLKNSNIGSREIRDHTFRAPSIENTTPFLNDFSHYLNSAYGMYSDIKKYKDYTNKNMKNKEVSIKTYLGFSTGRISQNEPHYLKLNEYVLWLDSIVSIINSSNVQLGTFYRYATNISNVTNKTVKNILLDLFDIDQILQIDDLSEDLVISDLIEDKCININPNNGKDTFDLILNDTSYIIEISYDIERRKYVLNCPQLTIDTIGESSEDNNKVLDLIRLLNEKQAFRIITANNNLYANGHFYNLRLPYGKQYNEKTSVFEKVLFPIKELSKIASEKGTKSINNLSWDANTLFNLIDNLGNGTDMKPFFDNTEILICDDMGTELADFILVKENKLVFIHVKGKGNTPKPKASLYSASALSDVVNQAIKNIYFMSSFDETSRINYKKWGKEWILKNKKLKINAKVESRIRKNINNLPLEKIWGKIESLKYDPNSEKEVWLILGMTFSKRTFISKLKEKQPPPEALQSAISLKSTIANIGSMGVKTKIFCST